MLSTVRRGRLQRVIQAARTVIEFSTMEPIYGWLD